MVKAGANREIADVCKVSTSTVSKCVGGKKVPLQASLDAMSEWWRAARLAISAFNDSIIGVVVGGVIALLGGGAIALHKLRARP